VKGPQHAAGGSERRHHRAIDWRIWASRITFSPFRRGPMAASVGRTWGGVRVEALRLMGPGSALPHAPFGSMVAAPRRAAPGRCEGAALGGGAAAGRERGRVGGGMGGGPPRKRGFLPARRLEADVARPRAQHPCRGGSAAPRTHSQRATGPPRAVPLQARRRPRSTWRLHCSRVHRWARLRPPHPVSLPWRPSRCCTRSRAP
jgi:hypothetical protein